MVTTLDNINRSLDNQQLAAYIAQQLNHFFPDPNRVESSCLLEAINQAEERVFHCFSNIRKKYFHDEGVTHFNHLISDQYCMYLYMLANSIYENGGTPHLSTKLYYLNKALHSVDIYYTTKLPEIFLLVHPIGTIIGRGNFSDFFIAYQGCTVGCLNEGTFPTFKGKTIMYANSKVLGDCIIGNNVCIAADSSVINRNIPSDKIVIGNAKDGIIKNNNKRIEQRPPFKYGN